MDDLQDDLDLSSGSGAAAAGGGRSLASLSVVDGGLEVDLGEATLQINSAGSIDINVREGGTPRSRRSRLSSRSRTRSRSRSHGLDDFLERQGLDASLIEGAAVRTATSFDDGGDDDDDDDDFAAGHGRHGHGRLGDGLEDGESETGVDFADLLRGDDDDGVNAKDVGHERDNLHLHGESDSESGESGDDGADENFASQSSLLGGEKASGLNTSLEARLKRLEALLEDEANASREIDTTLHSKKAGVDLSESKASLEARMQRLDKLLQASPSQQDDDGDNDDQGDHGNDDEDLGMGAAAGEVDRGNPVRFDIDHAAGDDEDLSEDDNGLGASDSAARSLGAGESTPGVEGDSPGRFRPEDSVSPQSSLQPIRRDDAMDGEDALGLSALDNKLAEDDVWERMNRTLQQAGFGAVEIRQEGGPAPGALLAQLRRILAQYHRRGEMIEELTMEESSSKRTDEEMHHKLGQAHRENARLQERLKSAQAEAHEAQERQSASHRGDADQLRSMQRENAALRQKLSLSEHRVRAKEAEMDRMHKKLAADTRHATSQRERTRAVFRDVAKRDPRASSQADQKLLDVVEGFDAERRELREERDLLNAEIRRLNRALEDRENELNGSRASSLDDLERSLLRKAREADADQRVSREAMDRRERAIIAKLSKLEGQLAEARRAEQRAADHVENLKLELASRPTMRDWKASQRRIAKLEAQVQSAVEALEESEIAEARRNNIFVPQRASAASSAAPAMSDHLSARDRVELMAKRAVAEASDNRRRTSTAELIRRDKLNHRLGLSRVTALPKTAAHDILQEICRILELSDVDLVVPALQKMCWVVRAMPRLERFAKDISGFVLLHGDELTRHAADDAPPTSNPTTASLQAILPQLKRWVNDVRTVSVWREFREDLLHELSRAPSMSLPSGDPRRTRQSCEMNNAQIVQAVRDLVSLERGMMDHQTAFRAADSYLADNPDALVSRCVAHFQQLFELRSVEGVIPKMNELYVYTNEMRNFMQVLRPTIGLGPSASVHACLAKLQEVTLAPSSESRSRSADRDKDEDVDAAAETKRGGDDSNVSSSRNELAVHLRLPQWEDTETTVSEVNDDVSPQEEQHHFLD